MAFLCLLASAPIRLSAEVRLATASIAKDAGTVSLYEPVYDSVILQSLDLLFKGEYAAADSALALLPDSPARAYFRGLVGINRFEDLGDTAALFAAERTWNALDRALDTAGSASSRDPNYPLYRGLAELQLSYVADKTGARLRAVRLGRKAVKALAPLSDRAEAAAALALYDYYKAALLSGMAWLPFVTADKESPLQRLETAVPRSRYLREILQTSLLWIHYDAGRYDTGLGPIRTFLARYPGNRAYRQMLADFLFRKGDFESARALQDSLLKEYESLGTSGLAAAGLPLGYLSAIGNLAKLDRSQHRPEGLARHLEIWYSPRNNAAKKWLPPSLVREVDALKR